MSILAVVQDISGVGVVKDLPAYDLPVNAFTSAIEMAFRRGFIKRDISYTNSIVPTGTPTFVVGNIPYYATATKIYLFNPGGGSPTDISRVAPYTGDPLLNRWNYSIFQNLAVFNNGKDAPQGLAFGSSTLADLPGWSAGVTARVVRAFKNFLVGFYITKVVGGITSVYPAMVKWSTSAAANTLPTSWDETDATLDAGETVLIDADKAIVDALPLGDINVIYLQDKAWRMQLSGNSFVFDFTEMFPSIGLIAQDCVKSFKRMHFVVTNDDVVVHDGYQAESVASDFVRDALFSTIWGANQFYRTTVVPFRSQQEMWVCYSTNGDNLNKALVWNWRLNKWYERALPSLNAISEAIYDWDSSTYGKDGIGAATATRLLSWNQGQVGSVTTSATLERQSCAISVDPGGLEAQPAISNPWIAKDFLTFVPQITGTTGKELQVSFAVQMERGDTITYSAPQTWTIGTTKSLPIGLSGRFLSYRIQDSSDNRAWQLENLAIELNPLGRY